MPITNGKMFTVVDLFCGAGGFSRGFKEENFKIMLGVENFKPVAETFQTNFPSVEIILEDIKKVRSEDIEKIINEPDVVIGSPPCEPFTRANPKREKSPLARLYEDPIGQLVLHFIRIVGDLKPKIFIMENVPGILEGELKRVLMLEFSRIGYRKIYFNFLKAEDYGTPSHRLRVFISNIKIKPKKCNTRKVVIEAIGDLPAPDSIHDVPNHEPVPISPRKLKRIAKLKWGESLVRYKGAEGRIYTNLTRLHPYKIAPTVMGSSRFIHPLENRLLTVREHARLMGFPDDHIFIGGRDLQFNQVGEAVPVPLAKAIAQEVAKKLKGE